MHRTELNDKHRAALRGMENALANDCMQKLVQAFPPMSERTASYLVVQFISEVEAMKQANKRNLKR